MAAERGASADGGVDDGRVVDEEFLTVVVRPSPRYGRFLGAGIVLGLVAAAIITFTSSGAAGDPFDAGASGLLRVFGVAAGVCVAAGLLITGTLALILDRIVSAHARPARAEHVTTIVVDLDAPADDEAPQWARDADDLT
ncbi:hypothetical protein NQ152_03975 [Microbacterium sp. zg.B48]|uniref:hypothetical protein n=1 Tax=unclassified Microbacterium TaxID=2609290 RepID=UPI00214CD2FA|nr:MULTISPECIES: hypothetical protein [unclassified Microbacterium]MCR2762662.1 hypothetical protein [Microbacterium sp. zg.B48]MCR2808220.1 hypothetical protein [Microbacterium sp. zg.B185]WIM19321.1 hypothetical protein QNO12_00450 [Microbacterium sp. zg-B185]